MTGCNGASCTCASEPVPDAHELRDFLKANATVVAPGETLVIQVSEDFRTQHVRELHESLNGADDDGTPWLPFRSVIVPGVGLGIVRPADLKTALRDLVAEEIRAEFARQQNKGLFA